MGVPLESNYFSSGSTVTRAGLQKMCQTICDFEDVSKFSKKTCLEVILQHFGDTNGMQGYFLSPGSTVTRKALMRIYSHILKIHQLDVNEQVNDSLNLQVWNQTHLLLVLLNSDHPDHTFLR